MNENDMQHGIDWDGQDVSGYIATEKYNGCRAYWDGNNLWSRGGLKIDIPDSWRATFPVGVHLDGEIYDGIDGVYSCGSAIRYGRFTPTMRFIVFDCPTLGDDYPTRLKFSEKFEDGPLRVAAWREVSGLDDAKSLLAVVVRGGGEGLMLRRRHLKYLAGRTTSLLKLN